MKAATPSAEAQAEYLPLVDQWKLTHEPTGIEVIAASKAAAEEELANLLSIQQKAAEAKSDWPDLTPQQGDVGDSCEACQ